MVAAIREEDVARIVQAYALAAIDPSCWLDALQKTSDAVGATCSALEYIDLNTGEASMECSFQMEGRVLRDYEERVFHINPRVYRAMPLAVGRIAGDRELLLHDDPNVPEFLDWLENMPYYWLQGAKVLESNGHVAFFATHYSRGKGPPQAADEKFHNAIIPHIINMHEVGRALSGDRLRNELVTNHALDSKKPFALLDRAGRLLECSPGFEAALRSTDLLGVRGGQLFGRHARHRTLVERFLTSAVGADCYTHPPLPIRLVGMGKTRGVVLRAVPIPAREEIFDVFRPAALIVLVDLDAPFRVRHKELSILFELTGREAEVAASIGEGCSIEQTALSLAISPNTVKQHLKMVFAKMCVERQSDLVGIVARLN